MWYDNVSLWTRGLKASGMEPKLDWEREPPGLKRMMSTMWTSGTRAKED